MWIEVHDTLEKEAKLFKLKAAMNCCPRVSRCAMLSPQRWTRRPGLE